MFTTDQIRRWCCETVNRNKSRSIKSGVVFDVDVDDVIAVFPADGVCPALGIDLVLGKSDQDRNPSLDRLVSSVGYVRSNIAVISRKANRIKNDGSLEEIVSTLSWLKSIGG